MECALYKDCHALIEEFTNNGSVDFPSFSSIWKKQMFQYIYAMQSSVIEIILTTNTIMHMAKRSICAKDEFGKYLSSTEGNEQRNLLRRIGGVYLMYAIYFKQPTKQFVKVSVSLETWREIVSFIESLDCRPELDQVRYIFWRLYQADAFRFTAMDYYVGPELVDYDKITEEHNEAEQHTEVIRVNAKDKLLLVPEIQENLKEMTAQEEEYNQLKKAIGKGQNQSAATLPRTEVFKNINSAFSKIKDILDGKSNEFSEIYGGKSISTRRKDLKRKAAGRVNYKEKKSNNSTNESSSSEIDDDNDDEDDDQNVQWYQSQAKGRCRHSYKVASKSMNEKNALLSNESDDSSTDNSSPDEEALQEDNNNESDAEATDVDSVGASTSKSLAEDCNLMGAIKKESK
ncbi:snRNA-activating protein complex subunit 1 [Musca domestica]|uniref:snRNA-activating protein complex subunit 1 n=1 Tax=Musca domestica TaxID=7370 RepID=A0A1I8MY61_MUSDO|nr:snRNA-activating protein complex subunit 1 [Musca domestica]